MIYRGRNGWHFYWRKIYACLYPDGCFSVSYKNRHLVFFR